MTPNFFAASASFTETLHNWARLTYENHHFITNTRVRVYLVSLETSPEKLAVAEAAWALTEPKTFRRAVDILKHVLEITEL